MASTNFISRVTVIAASWLNDVNNLVWGVFGGSTTAAQARTALGLGSTITGTGNTVLATSPTLTTPTLTTPTIDTPTFSGTIIVVDNNFSVSGSSDATKKLRFEVDGFTAAATRIITPPDMNTLLVSMVVKRKTADETVSSSNTIQADDHLAFPVGANEEWVVDYKIDAGGSLQTTGMKLAVDTPVGATQNIRFSLIPDALNAAFAGNYGLSRQTTSAGVVLNFDNALLNSVSDAQVVGSVWVLNGATPGNVTLFWSQFTSLATNLTFKKGSYLVAYRIA